MADISKLTLPDGSEYDLKVYTDHIAPMKSKIFTGVIGILPNSLNNSLYYFGKFMPVSFDAIWKIKWRFYVEILNEPRGVGYYEVECTGTADTVTSYIIFNSTKNTSYRPIYNHYVMRATQVGIENNYGHLIGERIHSAYAPTATDHTRTFKIDILECVNCEFAFFDTALLYNDVPGTGSPNYTTYTELNGTTNGVVRNGLDNNDVNYQNKFFYSNAAVYCYAAGGRYTLTFTKDGHYVLPITATDNKINGQEKAYTTESFDPFGDIYYRNNTNAIAANATVGNNSFYRQILVDARYSFTGITNDANSIMSAGNPVYIVCVPQLDGQAKLYTNPLSFTLPSTEDGLMYILLGHSIDTYRFDLLMHHPVYMYKNGAIREISGYAPYSGDAATVGGHTVASDVPSNAVFTDTTYSAGSNITLNDTEFSLTKANVVGALGYTPPEQNTTYSTATTSADGLMSSTDKSKLDGISSSYDANTETLTITL